MSDSDRCAICERPFEAGRKRHRPDGPGGQLVNCVQCGEYRLVGHEAVSGSYSWPPEIRPPLSCAAREAFESGLPLQITQSNVLDLAKGHENSRVADNIEKLLLQIAAKLRRPGGKTSLNFGSDFPLIDCYSPEEFRQYVSWIFEGGLVTGIAYTADYTAEVSLTVKGWSRVQPASRAGGIPGRCFVAMWFAEDTRAAYDNGIEPAISDAGFRAIRIDRKEHNNEIPDEIMAEIRNSEFMVADFTGQRAGVYYEAGFAMGLGRRVIWCCRKDEIRNLHFDTNHKNHIVWEAPEELREKLYRRIRATILEQG